MAATTLLHMYTIGTVFHRHHRQASAAGVQYSPEFSFLMISYYITSIGCFQIVAVPYKYELKVCLGLCVLHEYMPVFTVVTSSYCDSVCHLSEHTYNVCMLDIEP